MSGSTTIGARIREHRDALGMSQDELAQACRVSRQTISSWENGKTLPDIQSLALLAGIFDTGLEDRAEKGGFAAFCRRNYFPISIVVGVLFWFALDVVFEMSRSLPATIAFAVAWIVLEVLLEPSHEILDRLRGKKR